MMRLKKATAVVLGLVSSTLQSLGYTANVRATGGFCGVVPQIKFNCSVPPQSATLGELGHFFSAMAFAKKNRNQGVQAEADMKTYIPAFFVGLLVAAIWGYFSDLRNGQIGWFIGRLVFVSVALVVVWRLTAWRNTTDARA